MNLILIFNVFYYNKLYDNIISHSKRYSRKKTYIKLHSAEAHINLMSIDVRDRQKVKEITNNNYLTLNKITK